MEPQNKKIPTILLVIIVLLAALGGYGIWKWRMGSSPIQGNKGVEQTKPSHETQYVEQTKLPPNLPTDLPIEKGAIIARNEVVTIAGGREVQNIRTYYSKKTLTALYDDYKKYFISKGYKIAIDVSEPTTKLLMVDGLAAGTFKFTASKNSITSDITVEVVWVGKN